MKTIEELKSELETLTNNYNANPLPAGKEYNKFAKKWKSLNSQIKNYNNGTNKMKRAGVKVTKSQLGYKFNYKGITADIFLDGCETEFWSVHLITEHDKLSEELMQSETCSRKQDAVWNLYCLIEDLKI